MPERYQREIEDILKKSGPDLREPNRRRKPDLSLARLIWLNIKQSLGGGGRVFSPGRVMLAAVILLLSTFVVRAFGLGFVGLIAWAGLLLFIVGYAMFFVQPRGGAEKRWRGQPLEDAQESLWDRLRRRFKR